MKKFLIAAFSFFTTLATVKAQTFYGTTPSGGPAGGGTIIKFIPGTNSLVVAQPFETIAHNPVYANFIQAMDGKLYGMAPGGKNAAGCIFSFNPSTAVYTSIHDFDSINGADPSGSLLQAGNGKLYGMTTHGGINKEGVLFSFDPLTSTFTKLVDFENVSRGRFPTGSLVQASDGKLYGMTSSGGNEDNYGSGVIFSFDPSTNIYKKRLDLVYYTGVSPLGSLIQATDGKLYGMTNLSLAGGARGSGNGFIFSFDPATDTYSALKEFDGRNGANPRGSLVQAKDGKLYGMTSVSGVDDNTGSGALDEFGVIFSFNPSSAAFSVLKNFNKANGANPYGDLIQGKDGKLYGMTSAGGASGNGVTFSINPSTAAYSILKNFDVANGAKPMGSLLQAKDGKLYAMTGDGGTSFTDFGTPRGAGIIFSLDPFSGNFSKLKDFASDANGHHVSANLVKAGNGKLYGMTDAGGSHGLGVIFSVDALTNTYTKLADFNGVNGASPFGSLVQAGNGKLYGMTYAGGPKSYATIFSFNPTNSAITKLAVLDSLTRGITPGGNLFLADNGKLYGLISDGGSNGFGLIFSLDPATGIFTKLMDFNKATGSPSGAFVQAGDGKLYATTKDGGPQFNGIIFSYDTGMGNFKKLKDFNNADGIYPYGSLLKASDGKLYGTASNGGAVSNGVIFSFNPFNTTYQKLHDFDGIDGAAPAANLIQASDGRFYGTTVNGGNYNLGVVFSFDPLTSTYKKLKNFDGNNGAHPGQGSAFAEVSGCIAYKTYYRDADGDKYGNVNNALKACTQPTGYVADSTDCDDSNKNVHGPVTYYRDADGDGYGNPDSLLKACAKPTGYVTNKDDCDDNNRFSHAPVMYYRDADGDGFGDAGVFISSCKSRPPAGYVRNNYDCDDYKKANNLLYASLKMCRNGKTECVYAKDVFIRLWFGWKLGPCTSGTTLAARSIDAAANAEVYSDEKLIPAQYKLSNYPNPFAGKTTIRYALPVDSKVSLKVYDLMGRAVATLVDQNKKAGTYTVDFNAGNLSTGSLYYRLSTSSKNGRFEKTNKMIVVR